MNKFVDDSLVFARIISEHKGVYKAKTADHEYMAKITGKRIFHASSREDYPAVGDWVALDKIDGDLAVIQEILPRKTVLKRKGSGSEDVQIIAANVDAAFVVEAVGRDFNMNRLERYCAIAREGGVDPVIILNKIDLVSVDEGKKMLEKVTNRFENIKVFLTSIFDDECIDKLQQHMISGKTYCFLGSSGVGKSSLINALFGSDRLRVQNIGEISRRGQHTTTHREMFFLENGAIVIDNPGIREVGITDLDSGIDEQFDAIVNSSQKCKFSDCTHTHEPGCTVLEEVDSGHLDEEEYKNYVKLKKEANHYAMGKKEKREKNRKIGKFMKTAKKELGRYGHKDYGK